jgi:hypothetical protein
LLVYSVLFRVGTFTPSSWGWTLALSFPLLFSAIGCSLFSSRVAHMSAFKDLSFSNILGTFKVLACFSRSASQECCLCCSWGIQMWNYFVASWLFLYVGMSLSISQWMVFPRSGILVCSDLC